METVNQTNDEPWYKAAASVLFLVVLISDGYETEIVPASQLVETYLRAMFVEAANADEETRERVTQDVGNLDLWICDDALGPCQFSQAVGEIDRIEFLRITGLSKIGAIPSTADYQDGAPDCALMHILHPESAGSAPAPVYAVLPPSLARLAHH